MASPSSKITIDPNAPGTPMRYALAIEATLTICFGTYLLVYSSSGLNPLAANWNSTSPNPLPESLIQLLGIFTYGITIPLIILLPNTRQGIETRAPAYYFLGGSEVFLIAFFLYLGAWKEESATGMSQTVLFFLASSCAVPLAWSLYILTVKLEWVGRYRDRKTE